MAVDKRVGRKDYFTKYCIFKHKVDSNTLTDILEIDKDNFVGRFYAKDISAYDNTANQIGNHQVATTQATIETQDVIDLRANDFIFCVPERQWYKVVSVSPNSVNKTQRYSRRPVNVTTIVIRRGA